MKSFFKTLLACILGCIIASFIIFFITLGGISALVSSSDKPVEVKPHSVLYIDLSGRLADRSYERNPYASSNFSDLMDLNLKVLGLNDVLKAIEYAKTDANIDGIFIEQSGFGGGMATLEEVRNALIDFKQSGKFILSHSDMYTQKSYYMASVADRIYLTPEGGLMWSGLGGEIEFYAKAFEKFGVNMQVIRHGKFKSAVEPFMLDKMSPENREQNLTYMNSMWSHMLQGISKERNISVEDLNKYADNMEFSLMGFGGSQAIADKGMVDALIYRDQVLDTLKMLTQIEPKDDIKSVDIKKYINAIKPDPSKLREKNKIAVVYATGQINTGDGSEESIGSDKLSRTIRQARRDSSIKAIVLRINSPGGSALASEVIWREVALAKEVKPVVVSMGNVAASGGYYIAAPASAIVANPTTITGSIGVFAAIPNVNKTYGKLGITFDHVGTNKHSTSPSVVGEPLTAEERAVIQNGVEQCYSTFISHVAEGRGITTEQVDAIGQGRVWSGVNAKEIKLVDRFGGLKDAIALAAELAELESYKITELPKAKSMMEQMMSTLGQAKVSVELGEFSTIYNRIKSMVAEPGLQALLPYEIEIR